MKNEGPAPERGIAIQVDEAGRAFCDPYYAHVEPGGIMRWNFDGPWTIAFPNGKTPLQSGDCVIHGHGSEPAVRVRDKEHVHYPYSVAVLGIDGRGEPIIFLDVACPEIIVG